jgi:hypothetical protein
VGTESRLAHLEGYPFEVRYSDGAQKRATGAADVAAAAYVYFNRRFSSVEPDIALIVADKADWLGRKSPHGLPFFTDEDGIRPGVVVMPAGAGGLLDRNGARPSRGVTSRRREVGRGIPRRRRWRRPAAVL